MLTLIALILLPLAAIGVQLALELDRVLGVVGYSLYKVCFLVPPLIYCRVHGIRIFGDILKLGNWRRCLSVALWLGGLAVLIFWGVYYFLGDLLLDKAMVAEKIGDQFSVTASTVFLIAPVTIFLNSFLEEFFYRGFAFGLLVKKHRWLGYLLPATVFTVQHILFIYHWVTPLPFGMAVVALFVLALVLEKLYEKADSIVAPWLLHAFGDLAMMGIAVTMLWG
jgi:membrane protease YdiL (CAAX protease family)